MDEFLSLHGDEPATVVYADNPFAVTVREALYHIGAMPFEYYTDGVNGHFFELKADPWM
jgi:hypothetical protein